MRAFVGSYGQGGWREVENGDRTISGVEKSVDECRRAAVRTVGHAGRGPLRLGASGVLVARHGCSLSNFLPDDPAAPRVRGGSCKRRASVAEYLESISLYTQADDMKSDNAVRLMSLHASKGLEFDVVYLIGLEHKILPHEKALMDRAERTAERVKDAATEAGREVKEAVRTEISEHAPEVKQAVQDAGMTVKEQVKESAKKVKKEAKDAATEPGTSTNPRSTA